MSSDKSWAFARYARRLVVALLGSSDVLAWPARPSFSLGAVGSSRLVTYLTSRLKVVGSAPSHRVNG